MTNCVCFGEGITDGSISDKHGRAVCLETQKRKIYNTNVRICVANRIEGYKSNRTDNSYEVKFV